MKPLATVARDAVCTARLWTKAAVYSVRRMVDFSMNLGPLMQMKM